MLKLFFTFFKVGLFTFGGGWAMIPLIEKEVVDKQGLLDKEEFLDAVVVGQSMPGVMAVNVAILVGNKMYGFKGSLVATLGAVLPSFTIILLIAMFFSKFYEIPTIKAIFKGIRPAVVALIIAPVFTTAKSAKVNVKTVWIPIVCALAVWKFDVSPILLIILAVTAGIAIQLFKTCKKR